MIVDTHVHAVSADQRNYPRQVSPGAPGEWVQNMSAEMLLSLNAQAGIDKTVLVQAYSAYKFDNSYTADCATNYPDHFASVSILDPLEHDTPDNLSYWVRERRMRVLPCSLPRKPRGRGSTTREPFRSGNAPAPSVSRSA
jgi:L-fuconolactonase